MILPWREGPLKRGREIDRDLGLLTGEGADQRVKRLQPQRGATAVPVWETLPTLHGEKQDYYRLPVVKEPVWIWSVPAYFYVGGVAGGAAVLAAALGNTYPFRRLAGICRLLAFLGTTIGPALLTYDLGRPMRFLNMLRVFRPTSPMSIGSWALATTGGSATLALLWGNRRGARPLSWLVAGEGVLVAGYTGVLLGNTANPLWQQVRRSLPVLFIASSAASTAGLLEILPLKKREGEVADRFATLGKIAEVAGMAMMTSECRKNPDAARSLKEGRSGFLWKSSQVLLAAGIVASLVPGKHPWKRSVAGLLTTIGAVALRFALLEAGKQAAREPQAVIRAQQTGHMIKGEGL